MWKVKFIIYIHLKQFQFFLSEIICFNGYVRIIIEVIINLIIIINLFQFGLENSKKWKITFTNSRQRLEKGKIIEKI